MHRLAVFLDQLAEHERSEDAEDYLKLVIFAGVIVMLAKALRAF